MGISVRLRWMSSRGRLCDPVFCFILPDTAVKRISRQVHSPHKVPARDILRLPFPIKLTEPCPVDFNGFPSRVLALCLGDLDTLTLSLFELFTLQLREGSKDGKHKLSRRSIGVDIFLVADEGNALFGKGVNDVQQVFCGAS